MHSGVNNTNIISWLKTMESSCIVLQGFAAFFLSPPSLIIKKNKTQIITVTVLCFEEWLLEEYKHFGQLDTQLGPDINPIWARDFACLNEVLITSKHCLFSVAPAPGPHKFKPSGGVAFPQSLTYPLNTIKDLRISLIALFFVFLFFSLLLIQEADLTRPVRHQFNSLMKKINKMKGTYSAGDWRYLSPLFPDAAAPNLAVPVSVLVTRDFAACFTPAQTCVVKIGNK